MSRIGRLPVAIPAGVTVEVAANNVVTVTGPKGSLVKELPVEENEISSRSYKNTDQQHGCWCNKRIRKSSGS